MLQQKEPLLQAFEFVKAYFFFPKYCPGIKNYKNKMAGRNGKGRPLTFTQEDLAKINAGLWKLVKDTEKRTGPMLRYYRGRKDETRALCSQTLVKIHFNGWKENLKK